MKKENAMQLTLLKCRKKLDKEYKANIKQIKKSYKGAEQIIMLKNLEDQHYASLLALNELMNNNKQKVEIEKAAA